MIDAFNGVFPVKTTSEPYPQKTSLTKKDERQFYADHAQDWLVVAAWGHWHPAVPNGMVGVRAIVGGRERGYEYKEYKYFLVPDSEYGNAGGRFSFVVDPAKHKEIPAIT